MVPARILVGVNIRLPRSVRSIRRVQTIARVLTRHGFGHLVDRLNLRRFVPIPRRWRRLPPEALEMAHLTLGQRLLRVFEELGPTFIKLGQMISSRPDLFPPEIVKELVKLQDHVPPFDTAAARRIITGNLGAPVEEAFQTFEREPFASGSIAQVYRATTHPTRHLPSQRVVVKVKRPDIEEVIRLDMVILRWLADLIERWAPELAVHQPHVIVDEFERTIVREMDFIHEAATISRFAELYGDEDPHFRIPTVYWDLTGPFVLTLQELRGESLQTLLTALEAARGGAPGQVERGGPKEPAPSAPEAGIDAQSPEKGDGVPIDRHDLAVRLVNAFTRQFFEIGLFHADPHPGNLLIEPPATIGLIDFGLTGQLDDELVGHLVVGLTAAFNREAEVVVELLADMNCLGEQTDRQQLRRALMELIDKYYGLPLDRFDPQTLFYEFTDLIRRNDVTLPREFVMFGKALVGVGGICLQLDPKLNLLEQTAPKIRGLILQRFTPGRLARTATVSGWHLFNILRSAPGQLREVTRRLAQGHWQITIQHRNLDDLALEIDRASNRLGFAMLIAAIIVGSSWVISTAAEVEFLNIQLRYFGVIGYLMAGIMGLWLGISILRSGKLS